MMPNIESVCSKSIFLRRHKSKPTPNLLPVVRPWYYRDVERCQADSKSDFVEYLPIKC
ncbi:hypothetical protein CY34DRAFT_805815 [Suillus luteus UH-Slu-Lm8-n1]|uniref:Uncharacterized protein n=1 Tax=Suillus luteus UH-Slu-Lm8-n1 TaxID=930992 RepID=A0A0C9ZUW3_9AGAM|nr:hypothetical protein CY34DRAFT_805815 [Suillus luteus UH-Slu-Lm8-n1]